MAIENETADQVVRMVLQGSEVVLRLSGEAGMRIAAMIYNALKGDLTTKGKATLWVLMRHYDGLLNSGRIHGRGGVAAY